MSVQGSNSTCTFIRIQIKDLIYTRITSTCIFIKIKCHIKISSWLFISFPPPNDEKILEWYGLMINVIETFSYLGILWPILYIVITSIWHMSHFLRNWLNDKYGSRLRFHYYLSWQRPNMFYIVMCLSLMLQNITHFSRFYPLYGYAIIHIVFQE